MWHVGRNNRESLESEDQRRRDRLASYSATNSTQRLIQSRVRLDRRAARVSVNEIWQEATAQAHTQCYFVRLSLQV